MALTKLDRCDSCNAEAYNEFVSGESSLMFCKHHTAKFANALAAQGFVIAQAKELVDA